MYTSMIKLDSDVSVRCDFCGRTGKRGYMLSRAGVIDIMCPACYTYLYDGWTEGEAWKEEEVSWKFEYDFCNMLDNKND